MVGSKVVGTLHEHLVFKRRVQVLAGELAQRVPQESHSLLDVGCGDGLIDVLIQQHRPDLAVTGIDVLVRPNAHIPVRQFDGRTMPFDDDSYDVVMFVDVLHHTEDPTILLREAKRVARRAILLKDHTRESSIDYLILRFMDYVGNAHHGVALPYNYWARKRWDQAFVEIGVRPHVWCTKLGLYPFPASLIFENGLHFVSQLTVSTPE
jgi:SAM-dependent methyltransferase